MVGGRVEVELAEVDPAVDRRLVDRDDRLAAGVADDVADRLRLAEGLLDPGGEGVEAGLREEEAPDRVVRRRVEVGGVGPVERVAVARGLVAPVLRVAVELGAGVPVVDRRRRAGSRRGS